MKQQSEHRAPKRFTGFGVAAIAAIALVTLQAFAVAGIQEQDVSLATDSGLHALSQMMTDQVASASVPMALGLLSVGGQIVLLDGAGQAAHDRAATAETIVGLDSMTKAITATAVLILRDEGKLDLQDPVSRLLPEYAELKVQDAEAGAARAALTPLTIHHLLTHTGGLAGYSAEVDALWEASSNHEFASGLARLPLRHDPGQGFQYGNAYEVLPAVIEVASGMPFAAFVQTRILRPLKMVDSGFVLAAEQRARLAALYDRDASDQLVISAAPDQRQTEAFASGGGGLNSTLVDYHRFAQMLLGGGQLDGTRILSQRSLQQMVSAQVPRSLPGAWQKDYAWGYGLAVRSDNTDQADPRPLGTFGWNGGIGTEFFVDPQHQLIGIVYTQLHWRNEHDLRERYISLSYAALASAKHSKKCAKPKGL